MSLVYRIATADDFDRRFASPKAFIAHLLGQLLLEARRVGWTGSTLHEASWKKGSAFIAIAPAARGEASVDDVRRFIKETKR